MAESEQNIRDTPLHSRIYGYEQKLREVKNKSGTLSSNSDSDLQEKGNGPDSSEPQQSNNTYASVYQSMFKELAQQESASDREIFRSFIEKDFSDRFVRPQKGVLSSYREDITRQLQSPSEMQEANLPQGRRVVIETGVQHVATIAAVIGQVAKDSPEEAQALFSQLDSTLQTQVMSVQSDSFTSEQKLALLDGMHNSMLENFISAPRAVVSVLSLVSLGAIFIAGAVLGGPVGGTFAVGLAEMGAVSAHFMVSRAARVIASIYEGYQLSRQLSTVGKDIEAKEKEIKQLQDSPQQESQLQTTLPKLEDALSQLKAKRSTLISKREANKKQLFLKTTEFFSGAAMLAIIPIVPPPILIGLVLLVLSDTIGSRMEKFSYTFTGTGLASRAARGSLRAFSFALQLPKKLFQGVNNLGKLCEAQANKNKLFSGPLHAVGFILQFPSKLANAISSVFRQNPKTAAPSAADKNQDARELSLKGVDRTFTVAAVVKEGVNANVKEQRIEIQLATAKESTHVATRAAAGEAVASFFDVLSSFEDLRAYFVRQPSEKHHIANMVQIVHKEVHSPPVDSPPGSENKQTDTSKNDNKKPLLEMAKKVSNTNIRYDLSQLRKIDSARRTQKVGTLVDSCKVIGNQVVKSQQGVKSNIASAKVSPDRTPSNPSTSFRI